MKILQISFSLTAAGAERLIVDLCNQLSIEHDVYLCVICTDKNPEWAFYKPELSDRVHYINLGSLKGINMRSFFRIPSIIRHIKPDIVHAHLNVILYLYLPALLNNQKIKYYHTLHSTAAKSIGLKAQKKINELMYSKYIRPITVSKDSYESFRVTYNVNTAVLIENGRGIIRRSGNFKIVEVEVENLKNNDDDLVFIHIARFHEAKNQKVLLSTFNQLLTDKVHLILLIIGDGFSKGQGWHLTQGNKKGIYFLGPRSNIGDYLTCSQAFCLTSLWEGLPMALLEAFSLGIIPICTPAGGIKDIIIDGISGFLSESFSQQDYYNTVIRYLNDPGKISKDILQKYYFENFSMEKCAGKHIEQYLK